MVFYRKYRPQKVSELDITSVRDKLTSILRSKDIPHAFLFVGPKGLGKTSAARILAKAINCEKKNQESGIRNKGKKEKEKTHDSSSIIHDSENIEPCNDCEACTSITNGSNLDVIEIDAASNRGIEEIRDLREKIKFSPVSLQKKVYIIDEVHMLTIEAFNALLKTLEEPPPHSIFILCTTEFWKLPDTIVSRAFLIQFEKPSLAEMERSIKRVLKIEKMECDENLYKEIYSVSDGSFRDSIKTIEELSLMSPDKKLTKEIFESFYKTSNIDTEIKQLSEFIAQKNVKEALLVIDRFAKNGMDFRIVTEKIIDYLRKMLLAKSGLCDEDLKEDTKLDIKSINILVEEFSNAYKDLKFAVIPSLPLEIAIVKFSMEDQVQSPSLHSAAASGNMEQRVQQQLKVKSTVKEEKDKLQEEKSGAMRDAGKKEDSVENKKMDVKTKSEEEKKPATDINMFPQEKDFLKILIEEVKRDNHSIAGVLRGCKLINIVGNEIKLETAYKFHRERLSDAKVIGLIEKSASQILGRKTVVSVEIKQSVK